MPSLSYVGCEPAKCGRASAFRPTMPIYASYDRNRDNPPLTGIPALSIMHDFRRVHIIIEKFIKIINSIACIKDII